MISVIVRVHAAIYYIILDSRKLVQITPINVDVSILMFGTPYVCSIAFRSMHLACQRDK